MGYYFEIEMLNAGGNLFARRWPAIERAESRRTKRASKMAALRPTLQSLEAEYLAICAKLNARHRFTATIRTWHEKAYAAKILRSTKLRFLTSVWVGNFNLDILFPQLRTAFEINGRVHDLAPKALKDTHKANFLHGLEIALKVYENDDLYSPTIQSEIKKLHTLPRLDHRARVRLMRKIYLVTIAYHASDETLHRLFGDLPPTPHMRANCR